LVELCENIVSVFSPSIIISLLGAPPCSKTPLAIAESVVEMAKEHSLEVKVLGQVKALLLIHVLLFSFSVS